MGHAVNYLTFPEKTSLSEMTSKIQDFVTHSGDRYGTERITIPTDNVYEDIEAAKKYISSLDNSWYQGYAVRFQMYKRKGPSNKTLELQKKRAEEYTKQREYLDTHSVKNQKAALIGCPKCGSKLSREYMREYMKGNYCPVCRTNLLSATVQKRLAAFDTKIEKIEQQMVVAEKENREKADIKWLVKYEYHC